MSKPEVDKTLEDARCLWATMELFTVVPAEYRKRWEAIPLGVREKVLIEWRARRDRA